MCLFYIRKGETKNFFYVSTGKDTLQEAVASLFKSNLFVNCNTALGKYMHCCLQFRGDIEARQLRDPIENVKSTVKFVDW
jgi:tubulin alpha